MLPHDIFFNNFGFFLKKQKLQNKSKILPLTIADIEMSDSKI